MPDTDLSARVWPEDSGTGAADGNEDWDSAGYIGGMAAKDNASDYVEAGLGITPDYGTPAFDLAAGLAYIKYTGSVNIQLPSDDATTYSGSWDQGVTFAVNVDEQTAIALTDGAVNRVYLATDLSTNDGAYVRVDTEASPDVPTDPHIQIAEIDTTADTTTELARDPDASFGDVSVSGKMDAASAEVGELNSVTYLDQNDSSKPDVDDYLNNQLSDGETVWIEDGTHEVSEITVTSSANIVWEGELIPDGDHNVITFSSGATYDNITAIGDEHVSTSGVSGYSSNAVNFHGRFRIHGVLDVTGTGGRAVNIEQNSGSDNLNHSQGSFRLMGDDEGEIGLMVDNSSGEANNLNNLEISTRETNGFTQYGNYLNAGQVCRYALVADNNDTGIGIFAGDGPHGSSGTTNERHDMWIRSDGNNSNPDDYSSDASFLYITGSPNGGLNGLGISSVYRSGNAFRNSPIRVYEGVTHRPRDNPSPSEFYEGDVMVYVSDGSEYGDDGDLIYAWNDGGTVRVQTIVAASDATGL
ncbi:hypothetical protein [Natronorubrum halophilum]|uniref:hypothetical protein n=1 Tax=Natronorubrum halophilum TaxID=1702106 RepID=UPI0010C15EE3|nr:hypothetical protein [Natronorubrum halophilum]